MRLSAITGLRSLSVPQPSLQLNSIIATSIVKEYAEQQANAGNIPIRVIDVTITTTRLDLSRQPAFPPFSLHAAQVSVQVITAQTTTYVCDCEREDRRI